MADWIKESFTTHDMQRILAKLIERTDIFAHLTREELAKLLSRAQKCSFPEGDTILREGSKGEFLYVLMEGEVSVRKAHGQKAIELSRLKPGASFGEMSLVDYAARSASVVALERCVLLRICEADCWQHPMIAAKLFRNIAGVVAQRLRQINEAYLWGRDPAPEHAPAQESSA